MQSIEPERSIQVFISYAHADQALRTKLEEHLSPLIHSKKINIWQDREIPPGENWENLITIHLNKANLILLLVSSSFIASKYCWNKEVQEALERHKTGTVQVIPIILKPVHWQDTPLGHLEALPTKAKPVTQWHDQDAAFEDIVQGIHKVVNKLRSHQITSPNSTAPHQISTPPLSRTASHPKSKRIMITAFILILLLSILAGTFLLSLDKNILRETHLPTHPITTTSTKILVTLTPTLLSSTSVPKNTPTSQPTSNPTNSSNTTSKPPTQRQLSATQTQSQTVKASGLRTIPATNASGILTFCNADSFPLTVYKGDILTNNEGTIHVIVDNDITIPNSPNGSNNANCVTGPGHVQEVGAIGNIPIGEVNGSIGNHGSITNNSSFSGGQDASTKPLVQQSDIDNAANPLKKSTQKSASNDLSNQLHSDEYMIGSPLCNSHISSNHNAGDQAATVTVMVQSTCSVNTST